MLKTLYNDALLCILARFCTHVSNGNQPWWVIYAIETGESYKSKIVDCLDLDLRQ